MTTVTLTVVYDSSGTWDFSSTDSSVTGVSGTAITVTDGTNYYYYTPATDTLGTSLSGGTWQTVYGLGDGTTSSSPTSSSDGYVQGNGGQYINTGCHASVNGVYTLDYQGVSNSNHQYIFGFNVAPYLLISDRGSNSYYFQMAGTHTEQSISTTITDRHTLILDVVNSKGYVDTTSVSLSRNIQTSSFIYLLSYSTTAGTMAYGKLYSAVFTTSGTETRNFIPIQIGSSGEYALYDISFKDNGNTKVIYTNDGSGSFTGGGTQSALTYTHTYQPTVSVFNATSDTWVDGTPYVYDGTDWKQAEHVHVYDGTAWVEKT